MNPISGKTILNLVKNSDGSEEHYQEISDRIFRAASDHLKAKASQSTFEGVVVIRGVGGDDWITHPRATHAQINWENNCILTLRDAAQNVVAVYRDWQGFYDAR